MDLDGDGVLDAVSGRYSPGIVTWFRGAEGGFAAGATLAEDLPAAKDGKDGKDGKDDMAWAMATTNFVDWDGDGDLDMVIGNVKGAVFLNLNTGDAKKPVFGKRVPLLAGGKPMRVTQKSDPLPVDWDGDGALDLLVADEAGDVTWFRGSKDHSFAKGVSIFSGQVLEKALSYDETAKRLEPHRKIPGFRFRLATADWNADGALDLLVGTCEEADDSVTGFVWVLLREKDAR